MIRLTAVKKHYRSAAKGELALRGVDLHIGEGEMVAISDIWGDYHSRIVDNFELISAWATDEGDA